MLDALYSNVGWVMKAMAKVMFVVSCVVIAILFLIIFSTADNFVIVLIAIVGVGVAILLSWVATLPLYGFGEIIDRLIEIECNTRVGKNDSNKNFNYKPEPQPVAGYSSNPVVNSASATPVAGGWRCACGREHPGYVSTCTCGKNKRDITIK